MSQLEELIPPTVRRLQILAGALVTGVVLFTAVAILVVTGGRTVGAGSNSQLFFYLVPAVALAATLGFDVFRRFQASRLARASPGSPDDILLAAYSTRTILGTALGEAVAFLSLVGYLVTANVWLLAGVAGAVVAMTSFWPSETKLRGFLGAISSG